MKKLLAPLLLLLALPGCMTSMIEESTNAIHCNREAVERSTEVIRANAELIDGSTKAIEKNHEALLNM